MYWRSNRKSGSPIQKIGSPPYFYFRFGHYCSVHKLLLPVRKPSLRRGFGDSDHAECRGVYGVRLRSSVFARRTCVYSKIFPDIPLVGPNAISKNSNNVVISSPRVFIFSGVLVPKDSFPNIWSRDPEHFRFGRQGAPNKFFSNSIFSATVRGISKIEVSPKFFESRVPPEGLYLISGGHGSQGSNMGARPPK